LSARALAPGLRIISIAHGRSAVPNLHAAGADKVIETREISGLRIWDIITRPVVTAILDHTLFGQANLNVAEIPLEEGAFLLGRPVTHSGLEADYDLILLGLAQSDGGEQFIYSRGASDLHLSAGDILIVIGPADAIGRLRDDLSG
jgi:voltage-gated potassium channel